MTNSFHFEMLFKLSHTRNKVNLDYKLVSHWQCGVNYGKN